MPSYPNIYRNVSNWVECPSKKQSLCPDKRDTSINQLITAAVVEPVHPNHRLGAEWKVSSPENNQYSPPCCLCTWTILQWVTALCPTLYLLSFSSGSRTTGLKIPERKGLYLGYLFVTTSGSLLSTDQVSINVCSCSISTLSFVIHGLLVLSLF